MPTYKEEIVGPNDRASRLAKETCFKGHKNCPAIFIVPHDPGNFRGAVGFAWRKEILREMLDYEVGLQGITSWNMMEEVENDGAGGKPQFFTLIGTEKVFRGLGWEIIAMTADDFSRSGRLPCIIDNEVQVKRITENNFPLFQAMMEGYGEALQKSNLVNITGETAIMKHSITAFCDNKSDDQLVLTWGASCIGLASRELLIDNSRIKPEMVVVGFLENGYRCNGGTFFTNLILQKFGPEIEKVLESQDARSFVEKLTVPSISYAKTVSRIVGWEENGDVGEPLAKIAGIAHITGGGVWGKFGEILPKGVGAFLYNMPKPPEVLLQAQEMSYEFPKPLSDYDFYETFHGGCGMLLVASDRDEARKIIDEAAKDGIIAQVVGKTNATGELWINSQARSGETLKPKD